MSKKIKSKIIYLLSSGHCGSTLLDGIRFGKSTLCRYIKFLPKPDVLIIFDIKAVKKQNFREQFGKAYAQKWEAVIKENNKLFLEIIGSLELNYFILNKSEDWQLIYEKLS